MSTSPENTRSAAFTPEQLAQVNEMAAALVKESVSAIFQSLGPALKDMALTPDKIRALNAPYIDPKVEARQKREMILFKQDEDARIKQERAMKDQCNHQDKRGQTSLRLIRNFPDRQPRGVCVLCHDLITPKEWRIGAPDEQNPRGKAYLAAPHKDYQTVLQIAAYD
jgi:hypothetical protein